MIVVVIQAHRGRFAAFPRLRTPICRRRESRQGSVMGSMVRLTVRVLGSADRGLPPANQHRTAFLAAFEVETR